MNIPHDNDVSITISERWLKAELLRFNYRIDKHDLDFWVDKNCGADGFIANLSYRVWTERLPPRLLREGYDIFVPETWWDMFKEKYFPQWLLNKFPTVCKAIHIQEVVFPGFKVLYPDFHPAVPKNQSEIRLHMMENHE